MQSLNGLENKRVVVIGGSSGIGFAVAATCPLCFSADRVDGLLNSLPVA